MTPDIVEFVRERAKSKEYRDYMVKLLCELVDINNTTSGQPLKDIVTNEHKAFDVLERSLRQFTGPEVTFERSPIDPAIADHPYYTRTYYTADAEHPQGLDAKASFRDRFNLLAIVNPKKQSPSGRSVLLNAHIDVVSPHYPSRVDDQYVHGRGACDDKGSVVCLAAVMRLWHEVQAKFGSLASRPHVYQFVIDEEPGGNGSLSAAMDKRFSGYEAIISECTSNIPYPANRGAMWFQMDMNTSAGGFNAAEIVPFIMLELAKEGQQLRAETNQPLFPREYVQVNLGSLNTFGKHPATVNDYVAYEIVIPANPGEGRDTLTSRLTAIIDQAVTQYTQSYADRTKELQPDTHQPKLKQHYKLTDLSDTDGKRCYRLEIFGIGGHMSALLLCDNALIKSGYILSAMMRELASKQGSRVDVRLVEEGFNPAKLVLMGGVGFTPSHRMSDLQGRLRDAAGRGIKQYNQLAGTSVPEQAVTMTYDKLHNEAYTSPTDCPAMKAFEASYHAIGLTWPKPMAWRASCDCRIYANSGYNTVTFGPGEIADAHGDHEKIAITELQKGLELLTLTLLNLTAGE